MLELAKVLIVFFVFGNLLFASVYFLKYYQTGISSFSFASIVSFMRSDNGADAGTREVEARGRWFNTFLFFPFPCDPFRVQLCLCEYIHVSIENHRHDPSDVYKLFHIVRA